MSLDSRKQVSSLVKRVNAKVKMHTSCHTGKKQMAANLAKSECFTQIKIVYLVHADIS